MGLPYDYARCLGIDNDLCAKCMRNTPGRPEGWQVYISAKIIKNECPDYIDPKEWYEPDR